MKTEEGKNKTVLVVDDDDTLREAIVFDFNRRGYRVFSACSGMAAFEIVQKEKIDVVITDVRMPNGDGVELLDNIKTYNLRIPVVIFVTGYADLSLDEAYDKGACAVMSKPFDRKALLATVQRSLLSHAEKLSAVPEIDVSALRVELKFSDSKSGVEAKALSIGQGGICLIYEGSPERPDQRVSFKIEHPGHGFPVLSGEGIVRWARETPSERLKTTLGIEFIFLDESCRANVISFLETIRIKAFIPKAA